MLNPTINGSVRGLLATMNNNYDAIYQKYAAIHNVDWKMLKAIATHESGQNPSAVNPNDPSIGLGQVLCSGYPTATTCTNMLYVDGWPPNDWHQLFDPDYNCSIYSAIYSQNLNTYGTKEKALAVYNDWGARNDPANGPFRNQAYVDEVLAIYWRL